MPFPENIPIAAAAARPIMPAAIPPMTSLPTPTKARPAIGIMAIAIGAGIVGLSQLEIRDWPRLIIAPAVDDGPGMAPEAVIGPAELERRAIPPVTALVKTLMGSFLSTGGTPVMSFDSNDVFNGEPVPFPVPKSADSLSERTADGATARPGVGTTVGDAADSPSTEWPEPDLASSDPTNRDGSLPPRANSIRL